VSVPSVPAVTVTPAGVHFDGSASTGVINAIQIVLAAPKTGDQAISMTASYDAVDNHYRHLFNLDGIAAVLHQDEIWVGNNNGASTGCAKGFKVPPSWSVGTFAPLVFGIASNGTITGLTISGVPAELSDAASTYFGIVNCLPITISASLALYVGGSGNVGFTDNFQGTISAFSF
jgi:hypothetical protein